MKNDDILNQTIYKCDEMKITNEKLNLLNMPPDQLALIISIGIVTIPSLIGGLIRLFLGTVARIRKAIRKSKEKRADMEDFNQISKMIKSTLNDVDKMIRCIDKIKSELTRFETSDIFLPSGYYETYLRYKQIEGSFLNKKVADTLNLLLSEKANIELSKKVNTISIDEYNKEYVHRINVSYQKLLKLEEDCNKHVSPIKLEILKSESPTVKETLSIKELNELLTIPQDELNKFKALCDMWGNLSNINMYIKRKRNDSAKDYYSYLLELVSSSGTVIDKYIEYINSVLTIFTYTSFESTKREVGWL